MKKEETTPEVNESNSRFDELIAQMEELNATDHGYSKDSMITIPGATFATFLNMISHTKSTLDAMDKTLEMAENVLAQARNAIAVLHNNTATMTLELMEQHISNIKAGSTTSQAVLDVEDAEQKIQEI